MSAKVALRSRAIEGSETATMFEIEHDHERHARGAEQDSSAPAGHPSRRALARARRGCEGFLCHGAAFRLLRAEPRVIGDVEQRRAEAFALVLAVDDEKFVLRRLPEGAGLAIFEFALRGQDDPPFASILRPRLKREIAVANERPQVVADRRAIGNERARQFGQRRRLPRSGRAPKELNIASI